MKILGIIPARGGSKNIPRKNLKIVAGKPLIAYALEAALKSKLLDRAIVFTEDQEIARVAKNLGAEVPFKRPRKLAGDEVSIIPVIRHAVRYLDKHEKWKADIIASIQPTSPLIETIDIDSAINRLIETGRDSVVSVCKIVHGHPYWAMKLEDDRLTPLNPDGYRHLQKQDLPVFYAPNGALYVRRREVLERWRGHDFALGNDIRAIIMDETESVNVNMPLDLAVAEMLLKIKRKP
jgi:CMP-N-acetylneuraminic acid synthetase